MSLQWLPMRSKHHLIREIGTLTAAVDQVLRTIPSATAVNISKWIVTDPDLGDDREIYFLTPEPLPPSDQEVVNKCLKHLRLDTYFEGDLFVYAEFPLGDEETQESYLVEVLGLHHYPSFYSLYEKVQCHQERANQMELYPP